LTQPAVGIPNNYQLLSISFVRRSIREQKESIVHPAAVGLNAINNQIENQETDNNNATINNSVIQNPYI